MRNSKFIVLALALVLLITSAFALTAMAEDAATPTLEIASKNLSYEDNIKLLFAVKAENIGDADVKLNFYEEDPTDNAGLTPVVLSAAFTPANSSELGIADHYVFFTPGLAAKFMSKKIFVQATATVNGTEYKSDVARYSIVEYCHEMIAKESTDAAKDAKFMDVIEYGAAIQSFLTDDGKYNGALATDYKYVTIDGGTLDGRYNAGIYLAGTKLNPTITGVEKLDAKLANGNVTNVVNGAEYTVSDSVAFSIADVPANPHTFEGISEVPSGLTIVPLADAPSVINQTGTLPSMAPVIRPSGLSGNSTGILFWNGLDGDSTVLKVDETAADKANANAVEFSCDMLINYQSTNNANREFVNIVFTKADGTVAYNLILRNTESSNTSTNIGVVTRNSEGAASGQGTFVYNADNVWFNLRAVYTTTETGIEVTLYANGTEFAQKHTVPYTAGNIVSADDIIANVYIYANTHSDSTVNIHYQFALDNINLQHVKAN